MLRPILMLMLVALMWAPAQMASAEQTPGQVYLAYQSALAKAKDFEAVLPYFAQSAKDRLETKATTADLRAKMFAMFKMLVLTDLKVTKETIKGHDATVLAEGNGTGVAMTDKGRSHRTRSTATLVKEGGAWKVVKEKHDLL